MICSHKKSRRLFQQSIDSFCSNGDRPNLNKQRSVPGSCYKIYTPINVMFARAVSFCRFSFFMKNKIPLLPKLRKNVWFKSRSVPGSCCKIWHQCTICLHEPWVLTGVSLFLSFGSKGDRPNLNKQRSVPGSCYKIYTPINVMFARAVSFCRFSFFMKNKIPLLPKLRKHVWFKSRSVPLLH